jgi:hypothetical protein
VVPFKIFLSLNVDGKNYSGYFKLCWMKIRLFQREFPVREVKEKKVKKEDKEQKFNFKKIPKIISLLYQSLPYFTRIFKAFLKSITFERFNIKLRIGLDSPYDTVMISGYLYSLMAFMNPIPRVYLYLEPDFQNKQLKADIKLKIKIKLLWIALESLWAITRKPVRSLINEVRKMR